MLDLGLSACQSRPLGRAGPLGTFEKYGWPGCLVLSLRRSATHDFGWNQLLLLLAWSPALVRLCFPDCIHCAVCGAAAWLHQLRSQEKNEWLAFHRIKFSWRGDFQLFSRLCPWRIALPRHPSLTSLLGSGQQRSQVPTKPQLQWQRCLRNRKAGFEETCS